MISIAIASLLIAVVAGYAAIEIAKLKYKESADLAEVKAEVAALRTELKSANTKGLGARLATIETQLGIRIF